MGVLNVGGSDYLVWPIPHAWGRAAYQLRKCEGGAEVYSVLLDGDRSTCDCRGFEAHGHCKHINAVTSVDANK